MCTEHRKTSPRHPKSNSMKRKSVQDSFKKVRNSMILMLHRVVGFVVGMKIPVTSHVRNAGLLAVPKLLEKSVGFRQLPQPRQRRVFVGLSTQVPNPISSRKVC